MYEQDINVLKRAIKSKLWRADETQRDKWLILLRDLSDLHGVTMPSLYVGSDVRIPQYIRGVNRILLNKYSIISFLHEFGHVIGLTEEQCKTYSEDVFIRAYPQAQAYLTRDNRGYLVKNG